MPVFFSRERNIDINSLLLLALHSATHAKLNETTENDY